jgi:hypothetical protein
MLNLIQSSAGVSICPNQHNLILLITFKTVAISSLYISATFISAILSHTAHSLWQYFRIEICPTDSFWISKLLAITATAKKDVYMQYNSNNNKYKFIMLHR